MEKMTFPQRHKSNEGEDWFQERLYRRREERLEAAAGGVGGAGTEGQPEIRIGWPCRVWGLI